jgi:hypothetical protein
MSASAGLVVPSQALAELPGQLRADLLGAFEKIVKNYAEGRWEPAELNGGKLSEAAYSVCLGIATGAFPPRAEKPKDMVAACKALEQHTSAPRSVRIQIPRMVVALYEIRNNRSVGHLGGDVDPNHMDAVCVLQISRWVVAELIRVLHQLPADEAADLVETLVEREVPLVWKVDGKRRVLDEKMTMPDKTLLLLHGCVGSVPEADIFAWVEHQDAAKYRRDVLRRLHRDKRLEYDPDGQSVTISPKGVAHVEEKLLTTAR